MRNRILAGLTALAVIFGLGLASAPARAAGGPYYYAGFHQDLTATQIASATGASVRIQAWSVATSAAGPDHSLGEISVQSDGTHNQVVEAGYLNQLDYSLPHLFVNYWAGGVSGGVNSGFTSCTSSAVAGCSLPSWIFPGNNLSNSGQYVMRWWYTHIGTSSEGWWLSVTPSGGVPAGKQAWVGYYLKSKWGGTPSTVGEIQVFGEVYDTGTPPTLAMGTGTCPNGAGGGAFFDSYQVTGLAATDYDLNQFNNTSDPTYYNTAQDSDTGFRYGGENDPSPPC